MRKLWSMVPMAILTLCGPVAAGSHTDDELKAVVRSMFPPDPICEEGKRGRLISCEGHLRRADIFVYVREDLKDVINVDFTIDRNTYLTEEAELHGNLHGMLEVLGLRRKDYDKCIRTFGFSTLKSSYDLPDYHLTCTTKSPKRELRFVRK